jgi:hypothetical protein
MSSPQKEQTSVHIRLLTCGLEVDHSRAYWARANGSCPIAAQQAFDEYWFGARSLPRIRMLLSNFRVRFDAFPGALAVLHEWHDMPPSMRPLVCHWHLQLSDPLYRAFTGDYLPERRQGHRAEVTRDLVLNWLKKHGPEQWQMTTRIRFTSNLLSASLAAGLLGSKRDPRPALTPVVDDDALLYLLYLLRTIEFSGTQSDNPYLRSVGLTGARLENRLRGCSAVKIRRFGDLVDLEWGYEDLRQWAVGTGKIKSAPEGVTQ